ncbi:MAG: BNR-repeat neuraminidase N-terminal domain-containing protein, partial [Bacteroidota bacterium]
MFTRYKNIKWVFPSLLVFCFVLLSNSASAKDTYPSSFTSYTGGGSFCINNPATNLTVNIATTSCGTGQNVDIPITYSWYSNVTNSTVGGTLVTSSVGLNAGNITNAFTPPTNVVGTLYYYCVVSWAAGACAPAGSITTSTTIAITVTGAPCACTPSTLNCGANDFINNVELNTLVNSSTCAAGGYILYSALTATTSLRATLTYPLTISVGAGTGNHGAGVWFDWNRNGSLNDAGEFYLISNTIAPSTTFSINITVPAGASVGTTRMRIRYIYNVAVTSAMSCATAGLYGETEDYDIDILPAPVNMVYSSTNVTQVTSNVNAGSFRQQVLRVNVITTGQLSAPNATQMVFTTLGTTNVGDITNARVYFTGSSSTFATTTQLGATVAVPPNDPTNMTFNFTRALAEGDNNFWIAYDVVATAPGGNVIDAKLVSTTVAGTTYTLNATPAGSRPIVASTPMVFVSSTVVQNSNPLPAGSALNDVIQIQVVTSGAINPLPVTSMTFRTNGTTNTGDIQNARVFFTGDSPVFSAATQFGLTLAVPPAINTDFTMTGSVNLVQGTNYFWLVYDVSPAAACDPAQIDGLCNSIVIGGVNRVPAPTSPLGARVINCGTAYYSQGSLDMMNPSSWNTARNGSGTALGSVAALAISTNSFYVQNGHSMTTSIPDTISNLYLEPGSYVTASRLITLSRLYIQSFATYEQTYAQTNATIGGTFVGSFYIKKDGTWKHNNTGYLPGNAATQYFEPYSIQWFQGVGGGTFPGGTAWGTVILDVPNAPNLIINANSLSTIRGNFEIRRWGASTNYFYINM